MGSRETGVCRVGIWGYKKEALGGECLMNLRERIRLFTVYGEYLASGFLGECSLPVFDALQ